VGSPLFTAISNY